MSGNKHDVRPGSVAPLKNVASCLALVDALVNRPTHLPNIGVFSGFSGYGKTMAAQYCWNRTGALFIEVFDFWTRKKFCQAILAELGVSRPRGTIGDMMDEIIARLGDDPARPVIIDEADKLVDKSMIELVRDINKAAQVPVLLVGEEMLPQKLEAHERVHNRVLDWVLAQPCDLDDARALAKFLYPSLSISDALLDDIRAQTRGKARRIATTLNAAANFAANSGITALDIDNYEGRIFTGDAPKRNVSRRAA
ncbi:ATP-binding protein [Nitratireductor sp. GZWM139]|uniref:AAA family ATPase n=1 Tax=Nitratireductor sp. GZWM139 TaxID=2950541 RepID=UPI0024BEB603|nr:ATP-binding protein [Nitratireductor sp. GZWM139]MDJ1463431.1 ATP-binding protein [Nitratireductor sp. GZWM139]